VEIDQPAEAQGPEPKDLADTMLIPKAGKQPYDRDGTTLLWRALHNGRQENKPPGQYLHTPLDNNWPLALATCYQTYKHP